jgi:HKD family nuclease
MTELILNDQHESHRIFLNGLLQSAEEIYIAVAFLKMAGIDFIRPHLNGGARLTIIAGINFGITDPVALTALLNITKSNLNVRGFMGRQDIRTVFHPKLYLIKDRNFCHIISGSANLTAGGMSKNIESSIYHRCTFDDQIWKDSLAFFNACVSPAQADLISTRVIAMYLNYFKKQKLVNDQADPFPDIDSPFYDLKKLKSRYLKLNQELLTSQLEKKQDRYNEAKKVLEEIAAKPLPATRFQYLIERLIGGEKKTKDKLWASNSMFRQKTAILKQQAKFRKLINTIKSSLAENPEVIYRKAKAESMYIYGLGANFIGEIMMTYDYEKLPNFNTNPVTVLIEDGKVDLSRYTNSYNQMQYLAYYNIIHEIVHSLDLKNMLAADSFFDSIYQDLKNELKLKHN